MPGISTAVVKNNHLVWLHGFGYADIENRSPADQILLRWTLARLQALLMAGSLP